MDFKSPPDGGFRGLTNNEEFNADILFLAVGCKKEWKGKKVSKLNGEGDE